MNADAATISPLAQGKNIPFTEKLKECGSSKSVAMFPRKFATAPVKAAIHCLFSLLMGWISVLNRSDLNRFLGSSHCISETFSRLSFRVPDII
jgi:hypothetical protein